MMKLSELFKIRGPAITLTPADGYYGCERKNDMISPQEAFDYYDEFKKSHEADEKLKNMRDKIGELPTTDKKDYSTYICPSCQHRNWIIIDSSEPKIGIVLECLTCGKSYTPDYLLANYCDQSKDEDLINHPDHYISKDGIESIDVIRAFTRDLDGMEAVCTANILKYMMRWKHKNGLEDLKKAQWYLNYLITEVEVED